MQALQFRALPLWLLLVPRLSSSRRASEVSHALSFSLMILIIGFLTNYYETQILSIRETRPKFCADANWRLEVSLAVRIRGAGGLPVPTENA